MTDLATLGAGRLTAPFPWFGGKRRAANLVWQAIGDPGVYIEPFAGSAAVLLRRPRWSPKVRWRETINDADGLLCNFWRAAANDADGLAAGVDWPVNELDLHARHGALIAARGLLTERLRADPYWYDMEAASWWLWGICAWIGSGWSSKPCAQVPDISGVREGRGVHSGYGTHNWLSALQARLRYVRVCTGDWRRVLTPTAFHPTSTTGVFLDPPYEGTESVYSDNASAGISSSVRAWCLENGTNPKARIVLAGRGDEHSELEGAGWRVLAWEANGGYATNKEDRKTERLWLSPACLDGSAKQGLLL